MMDRPTSRATLARSQEPTGSGAPLTGPRRAFTLSRRHFFFFDLAAILAAVVLAFDLRFETLDGIRHAVEFAPVVVLLLLTRATVQVRFRLYQRLWRYASVADLLRVALTIGTGSLFAIALTYGVLVPLGLISLVALPLSFWPLEAMLTLGLDSLPRFSLRAAQEYGLGRSWQGPSHQALPTLLFGAGEAGAMLARSALRDGNAGVRPVGFLDDLPSRRGQRVAGLPVLWVAR